MLAPLFSLTAADDVTGMARGVAFQLVEALGVLERQKVAEEVKGLDQPARATLRKYGVRFGAYHIYLPILLKPSPRSMATQLWALKHESPDAKGVGDLLHLAASGRTSIPVGKDTPKSLYRTAGYRVTGERAVRVDILERLADLIRPVLSWREGSAVPKPAGAVDGRGFTVTGAMTSLTGASGEDFASILRSLGYRMDRKPKPVETPAPAAEAPVAAETAPIEAVAAAAEAVAAEMPAPTAGELNSPSLLPEAELMPAPVEIAAPEALNAASEPGIAAPEAEKIAAPEAENAAQQLSEDAAASENSCCQRMVQHKWRKPRSLAPARPEAALRSRPLSRSGVPPAVPNAARISRAARAVLVLQLRLLRPAKRRLSRRKSLLSLQSKPPRRRAEKSAARKSAEHARERAQRDRLARQDRRERKEKAERRDERADVMARPGGGGRGRKRDKGDQVERAEREQYYAKPQGQRADRNKQADPNSPFAKLAALKQQLEQNTKEPT